MIRSPENRKAAPRGEIPRAAIHIQGIHKKSTNVSAQRKGLEKICSYR